MKITVRPKFWRDMERQQLWLLQNVGADLADRWFEAVWQTVQFLQRNPEVGRLRLDLQAAGIRSWLVKLFPRWTIFYGLDRRLVLYRVVGGEMDLRGVTFD
jgi:plasmid stabilization system protein ParE